jgi:hypothetical protein
LLVKYLNCSALDDDVERTGTYRDIQQVADNELDASTWPTHLWTSERTALPWIIRKRLCEARGNRRDVQCGYSETGLSECARLL